MFNSDEFPSSASRVFFFNRPKIGLPLLKQLKLKLRHFLVNTIYPPIFFETYTSHEHSDVTLKSDGKWKVHSTISITNAKNVKQSTA